MTMKLSANGRQKIIGYEGKLRSLGDGRYIAYRCPANVPTIYTGCTHGVHDGMIVTEAEGEAMFAKELAKFEDAVARLVKVELNQNEFDALVSFAYNCGEGALARSTILKKLNKGDRVGAAGAFKMWNKGGGRVLRGLVERRASEAALFLKPVAAPPEPAMPQMVTPSKTPERKAVEAVAHTTVWGGLVAWWNGLTPDPVMNAFSSAQTYAPQAKSLLSDPLAPYVIASALAYLVLCHVLPRYFGAQT